MNPRTTVWLLVATLALAAFVYLYEIRGEPARLAAAEAEGRLFPDVTADAIGALRIRRPGEPETHLERGPSGWRLVAPLSFPANGPSVQAMVRALGAVRSEGRIDDPVGPEVYGLAGDAILVSFTAGRARGLRIGGETPMGASLYVAVVGGEGGSADAIHMAPIPQLEPFDRSAEALRDQRVLDFAPETVDRVALEAPGLRAVLSKDASGWKIIEPAALPADGDTVDRLVSDLSHLRADSFLDEPGAGETAALQTGATRIELSGPETVAVLRLAAPESDEAETRIAEGREGFRYRVRRALVAHLPSRLFELREKTVTRFDPAFARSLELDFGTSNGGAVRVTRATAEDPWLDAGGGGVSEGLALLMEGLANLEAADIVADALGHDELRALGLEPPFLAVRVASEEGVLAALQLGPPGEDGVLARTTGDDVIYRLASTFGDRVPKSADVLREPATTDPSAAP